MPRVTRAADHLSAEEVKHRMQSASRPFYQQRWLIMYNAFVDPRTAEEIARRCGVGKGTVRQLVSRYNRFGVSAIETQAKGGRRRECMTREQEKHFLHPFFTRAHMGEIATITEIQQAFEITLAHEVDESTIYRLLDRHGWRELMPRPRHPQASEEAQDQFKKTSRRGFKRHLRQEEHKTRDRF